MIIETEVAMPRYGMTFSPWSNWSEENTPPNWWTGNNKVKHHRSEHFNQANLKNVLNATAGLLILLLLFYSKDLDYLDPAPKLFMPKRFVSEEGNGLRLIIPDGTTLPWS
ncbi:hypothetical protein [Desulfogranum marinum]|uniref:hypothetical protein n=1 Tax=Desulfogranum marinum TaxID=453220 RepID=UPI001962FE10|nr:hypothetical protein [Desulfogranum marinum]MBM9513909.1 hypothetical protein [Desulfogranum marinum]